jgi:hypothetical protein
VVLVRFLEGAVGEWVYKLVSRCCPGAAMLLSAFRYKKSLSEDCYFSEALEKPVVAVAGLAVDLMRCLGGKRQAIPLPAVYRCSLIQFKIF